MKLSSHSSPQLAGAIALVLTLAACGGGSDSSSGTVANNNSNNSGGGNTVEATAFPVGLAVASPAETTSSQIVAQVQKVSPLRFAADLGRNIFKYAKAGDWSKMASLTPALLPGTTARAADGSNFSLNTAALTIEAVLSGSSSVSLEDVLQFQDLFRSGANANCYGPSIDYANHDNGSPASGELPSGDLGLWLEHNSGPEGQTPCVAAQLNQRVSGVKAQTMQGLLMMAAMRYTVSSSSTLDMPSSGGTTDLTTAFESLLHTYPAFSSLNVSAATIGLDSAGEVYTFRLVIDNGATGANARSGEIIMAHNPGATDSEYTGVMQVAALSLGNDAAMGCVNEKDSATNLFQVASISSVRYARNGNDIDFSARNGNYCGTPADDSSNYAADLAGFDDSGELDPSVKNQAKTDGSSKGWLGNFSKFAGSYDSELVEGNFLYAWQAGVMDDKSRMLSMTMDYDAVSSSYTLQGFFGYADNIVDTNGTLLGMICNWAGPGNNHNLLSAFQSQTAELSGSATAFTIPTGGSKITYAPTNNCDSTTTQYDVDANGTLDAGEGVGTVNDLDAPAGGRTVQGEIEERGFVTPTLF